MTIVAYQIEEGTCRFIYYLPSGNLEVVSVENYGGMLQFLKYSQAEKISNDINIYQYAKNLQES